MSLEKETSKGFGEVQEEYVERRKSTSEEVTELSAIEATAASSAAWLISMTVSIGGFLFG
jgi:MFS transporter, SP family, solute carrier family 2 (myo-inositol transporter), member 13